MKTSLAVGVFLVGCVVVPAARAEPPRDTVRNGLDWLARQQHRDGTWTGNGNTYPTAVTALAGTALLMEGSTLRDGAYSDHLRRAAAWYRENAQEDGLLTPAGSRSEEGRCMISHGYAMLFLSSVYAQEGPGETHDALQRLLDRAVDFSARAQTKKGGWGYVTAADGADFDEGCATVAVLHGLLSARRVGISVPREVLDKAQKYHAAATNRQGGVLYSLAVAVGDGRPAITAGAAACALMRTDRSDGQFRLWAGYLATVYANDFQRPARPERFDALEHLYLARVVYGLGEGGHEIIDPAARKHLPRWEVYRNAIFPVIQQKQEQDGRWSGGHVGPVYETALRLMVLQLDGNDLQVLAR